MYFRDLKNCFTILDLSENNNKYLNVQASILYFNEKFVFFLIASISTRWSFRPRKYTGTSSYTYTIYNIQLVNLS